MSLYQHVIWGMAAILRDSTVVAVAVVRTRPRAIPLAMITMRKSTHGFPFVSHIWDAYGAPLGGPSGRRSSAINLLLTEHEGRTREYWPKVVAVWTKRSEVLIKTTEDQCSPVQLEQARLVSSLLYALGSCLFCICQLSKKKIHSL